MIEAKILISAIVSLVLVFLAAHIVVVLLFPRLKTLIMGLTKDEKVANAVIAALFFIISVYILNAIIPVLSASTIPFVEFVSVIQPPLNVLVEFVKVVQWVVVAAVVALGLK